MIGILVCGDNHFIVDGPRPDAETAKSLAKYWSVIQIGRTMPHALQKWRIVTRAFRENLEWATVVPGDGEMTPSVALLLNELSARGIAIERAE
jgi:hypothetical protein